jgi:hypothetical protein
VGETGCGPCVGRAVEWERPRKGIFGGEECGLQAEGTPETLSTSVILIATAVGSMGERERSPMRCWLRMPLVENMASKEIWQNHD